MFQGMRHPAKDQVLKRLSRIEGQVRGLSRMVEEDRASIDVITQIAAARAALRKVEQEVLRDHVGHCLAHALSSADAGEQQRQVAELMDAVVRSEG